MNLHTPKPVIQVGTKQPPRHHVRERPIGGCHNARVDTAGAGTANALDRKILDGAQELCLGGERQVRNLVEKQCAAVCVLELPPPAAHTGGCPFLDAEQLRLEQRFDERGAVHRDKRPGPTTTDFVELACNQLLPGAALAFYEDREISSCNALDAASQHLHDSARANEWRRPVNASNHRRHPRARCLEHKPRELRSLGKKIELRLCRWTPRVERGLENRLCARVGAWHAKHNGFDRACRRDEARMVARGNLAEPHGSEPNEALDFLLEHSS